MQRSAYDRFLELLEPAVQGVRVEDPALDTAEMGPLISRGQWERVASYVPDDAPVAFRGSVPGRAGLLVPADGARPRRPARPGGHRGDLRPGRRRRPLRGRGRRGPARQRQGEYGLSGSIWTRDLGRALRVSRGIEAGNLSVNSTLVGALLDAVRRLQAVRARPGARARRAALVHRREERVPGDGRLSVSEQAVVRRLVDRVAVVTGGASGIGLATARRFAAEGAHVVVGDVDPTSGKAAAEEVGGLFVQVDVTSPEQVEALFQAAVDTLRRARHRVQQRRHLAAGRRLDPHHRARRLAPGAGGQPDLGLPLLQGGDPAHAGARAAARSSTPRRSWPGWAPRPRRSPTPRRRAACWRCRRELGVQFAREGIRVNALSPGPVNTPLLQELFAKDPERAARRLVHIPMGRFAEPEEIAAAVAFLASDDSSFITASEFLVDGGISGAYVTPL